jgi:glycosyltransferase involved in cell wall biosynthesis
VTNFLISLVVPTYNRAFLLPATLRSLQAQRNSDYEIIIVDDGSTDNTEVIVQPFLNSTTRYIRKDNAERAAARNFGARLAKGRYINFFDSDDLALPNHTAEAALLINSLIDPEWFHLAYEWVTPQGTVFRKINQYRGHTLNDQLAEGNLLSCNGVFVRRDIFLQHAFNENRALSASEDYELWLRLAARYPLHYSNTITSQLVDHATRSVRTMHGQKLIDRLEIFLDYIANDPQIARFYGRRTRLIRMDAMSYIALHLAAFRDWKLISLRYLARACLQSSRLLAKKRFYAIAKIWLFQWSSI